MKRSQNSRLLELLADAQWHSDADIEQAASTKRPNSRAADLRRLGYDVRCATRDDPRGGVIYGYELVSVPVDAPAIERTLGERARGDLEVLRGTRSGESGPPSLPGGPAWQAAPPIGRESERGIPAQSGADRKSIWRERTKARAIAVLGGQCVECGSREELEFDHVDGATKAFDISHGIRDGLSRDRLEAELRKCQLLCATCHREKTMRDGQHGGGHNRVDSPRHGTAVMYGRARCRCSECRQWKADYRANRVDSNGATNVEVAGSSPASRFPGYPTERVDASTTPEGAGGWEQPRHPEPIGEGAHRQERGTDGPSEGVRAETRRRGTTAGGDPGSAPTAATQGSLFDAPPGGGSVPRPELEREYQSPAQPMLPTASSREEDELELLAVEQELAAIAEWGEDDQDRVERLEARARLLRDRLLEVAA